MLEKVLILCIAVLIQGCATTNKNMSNTYLQKTSSNNAITNEVNRLYKD